MDQNSKVPSTDGRQRAGNHDRTDRVELQLSFFFLSRLMLLSGILRFVLGWCNVMLIGSTADQCQCVCVCCCCCCRATVQQHITMLCKQQTQQRLCSTPDTWPSYDKTGVPETGIPMKCLSLRKKCLLSESDQWKLFTIKSFCYKWRVFWSKWPWPLQIWHWSLLSSDTQKKNFT